MLRKSWKERQHVIFKKEKKVIFKRNVTKIILDDRGHLHAIGHWSDSPETGFYLCMTTAHSLAALLTFGRGVGRLIL